MLMPSSLPKEATSVSEPSVPQGPSGPDDKVSVSWLVLQRLDDLQEPIAAVSARVDRIEAQMAARFEAMDRRFDALERRWTWALGLVLVLALGLLAKLFLPGA